MMEVDEAYDYIRDIITEGFITLGLSYKDFNIVLKSLTDKEIRYLKTKNNCTDYNKIPILDKLMYSTYFLGGHNFLLERNKRYDDLKEIYNHIPTVLIEKVLRGIDKLFERLLEVLKFLEGYCYTDNSRALWKVYKSNHKIGSDTDIDFSSVSSSVRERWIIVNTHLDREDEDNSRIDLAMFVASAFNPKGVKSVTNSIKLKREEREKERDEIAQFGFNKRRIEDKRKKNKWSKPLVTNEDLVRELNKVTRGEKDRHDLFIEEWLRRKTQAAEDKKKAREEAAQRYRKDFQEKSLDIEGTRKASPEEIKKMIDKDRDKTVYVDRYSSAYEGIGKSDDFIKKIGSRVIKSDK